MRPLALPLAIAALLLPVAARSARAPHPGVEITSTWTRTDAPLPRFERVAVLPACGTPAAIEFADRWAPAARRVALSSIGGSDCARALLGARIGTLAALDVAHQEIRRDGVLSEPTARFLARALQVDALMLIRVDRWEQQSGLKTMAYVDATTTLVDSTGTSWWSSTAKAHLQSGGMEREVLRTGSERQVPTKSPGDYATVRASVSSTSGSSSGSSSSSASSSSRSGSSSSSGSSSGSSGSSGTVTRSVSTHVAPPPTPMPTPGPVSAPPYGAVVDSLIAMWKVSLPARP
jgi:hypothetical protein